MPQTSRQHQDSVLATVGILSLIAIPCAAVIGIPLALLAAGKISLGATVALQFGVAGLAWVLAHTVVPDRR